MTTFDSAENFGYFGKCLENPPTPRNNLGGSPSKLTKRLPAALKICNGILRQGHRSSRAKMRYHIISYPNCLGVPKSIFSHLRRGQLKLESQLRITECCRLHNVILYKENHSTANLSQSNYYSHFSISPKADNGSQRSKSGLVLPFSLFWCFRKI